MMNQHGSAALDSIDTTCVGDGKLVFMKSIVSACVL